VSPIYRTLAPAKVNLGLFLGPTRAEDQRHELVSVMQSISLADELTLQAAPAGAAEDEILCPGLPGPAEKNLAGSALRAFRASTGWDAPPLRLSIRKRIPVSAGLGGGSADAAGALRLASHASGLGDEALLRELGLRLGADVPAQVAPGCWLATGAGERLSALPSPDPSFGLIVLPLAAELSTAAVYAEADRLGLARPARALEQRRRQVLAAWTTGAHEPREPDRSLLAIDSGGSELLHNDLQRAAVSLCPAIDDALVEAREAGAELALVSGSGPTVVGLFAGDGAGHAAAGAAARLTAREPPALCARPVDGAYARVVAVAGGDALAERGARS
jgi:4-diphosphocytidyl-2-C-methyl-D-erythritol kinase